MATDLTAAMTEFKPVLAARFGALVCGQFDRMVDQLGPRLKGIGNDWTFARTWRTLVQPFVRSTPDGYVINAEKLANHAKCYADATVEEWLGKINAKLGDLVDAEVKRMDGVAFLITGSRNDHKVAIEQRMIVNVSARGTPFNQFPARIRVDGKAISEAAYKKAA